MKKFDVSIEGENVALRSSAGEIESIRLNGGAYFYLFCGNKLVLKIESPMVGVNGMPLDRGGSVSQHEKDTDTAPYEKSETKAARKEEPEKICGTCRHSPNGWVDPILQPTVPCMKKERKVPRSLEGCAEYEPRTGEESALERLSLERLSAIIKSGAEAAEASSKIAAEYLSGVDVSLTDKRVACQKKADSLEKERIKLQNENAELQKTNEHLRDELVWQFEQLTKKIGMLQDQNCRLRKQIDAAAKEKNSANSYLVEQLKQMRQRIEDLEREANKRGWPPRPIFSCVLP